MKMKFLFPILIGLGAFSLSCKKKSSEVTPAPSASIAASGDSAYTLSYGGLQAMIDYAHGGRLEVLSLNGQNFLSGKTVNTTNWGTSFWPSPQSAWGWPPSQQLDALAYTVVQNTSPITLQSQKDPKLGYVFTKSFQINTADTSLTITYTVLNDTNFSQQVAPWEISRVAPGGLMFYATGPKTKSGLLAPLTKDSIGITWFKYDSTTIPSGVPKLIADDSEGWLAKVSNGLILVKSFPVVTQTSEAPGEGAIEMYTNPNLSYTEIENQGAYVTLAAKQSLTYTVTYRLKNIPNTVSIAVGSASLAALARSFHK
jgi:hypothetical protein